MAIKKIKISELPLAQSLVGLFTIGVDSLNKSVKVSLEFLKTAADTANTAASSANAKAAAADQAASSANMAASNASAKASLAETKAGEASNATTAANQAIQEANEKIARMEELEESIISAYKATPTEMILEYPKVLTFGNTAPGKIKYTLLPADTGRNVLFLGDDNAVLVLPDGGFTINKPGVSRIHAIPTENTLIYQTIQITVVAAGMRKIKANSFRLMGNGNLRFT